MSVTSAITIDPRWSKEWSGKAGVASDVGMKMSAFREKVSDHLPVWAAFDMAGEDDD